MKYENNKIVYEVGDWVYIRRGAVGCQGADGKVGVVVNDKNTNGMHISDDGINVNIKGGVWRIDGDFRPATQEEIDKAIKAIEDAPIMIGSYEVRFFGNYIGVGCQTIDKEKFIEIGKKANWI